jgi:adenine deaminase
VAALLARPEIKYLAEMMNWPGVLYNNADVYAKIDAAKKAGKPIDGHAPGLKGRMAQRYAAAGMSTDHECFTLEEALDKLEYGMKIIIREGSAAKNFAALIPLMPQHHDRLMFCSDDKHPDELVLGHINQLAARAVAEGYDVFQVLQAACLNPIDHYRLDVGQLREGDPADFIVVKDLRKFEVLQTYIDGRRVADGGVSAIASVPEAEPNQFCRYEVAPADFAVASAGRPVKVIEPFDGELVTKKMVATLPEANGLLLSSPGQDVLKIAVVNRYKKAKPAVGFIAHIGLRRGAIASSVGHDSHNIVVVGADDASMARAVNLLMEAKGGVVAVDGDDVGLLPLPVAGLMSARDGREVADAYAAVDRMAKRMGSTLRAPFMTLSFMALLVIPSLKLSDLGLFNGDDFQFVSLHGE